MEAAAAEGECVLEVGCRDVDSAQGLCEQSQHPVSDGRVRIRHGPTVGQQRVVLLPRRGLIFALHGDDGQRDPCARLDVTGRAADAERLTAQPLSRVKHPAFLGSAPYRGRDERGHRDSLGITIFTVACDGLEASPRLGTMADLVL